MPLVRVSPVLVTLAVVPVEVQLTTLVPPVAVACVLISISKVEPVTFFTVKKPLNSAAGMPLISAGLIYSYYLSAFGAIVVFAGIYGWALEPSAEGGH